MQLCYWVGFRISLSLSRESTIFWDKIENYFSCSHLARRDRNYHRTILIFRDENEITYCFSHVSRRDRDFRKPFLVVEREKMKLTLIENSRDWEFSLTSDTYFSSALSMFVDIIEMTDTINSTNISTKTVYCFQLYIVHILNMFAWWRALTKQVFFFSSEQFEGIEVEDVLDRLASPLLIFF